MPADDLQIPRLRADGLQLEEHRDFQEKFWKLERVAWAAFLVFVALALAGLTGDGGILARGSALMPGATLDYPRIARLEATDRFVVHFDAGSSRRTLLLPPSFAANFAIQHVQPEPEYSQAGAEGHLLAFRVADGQPADVMLELRAKAPGAASYPIAVDGGIGRVSILTLP